MPSKPKFSDKQTQKLQKLCVIVRLLSRSDSDQKSIIDHFRLIGPKTIDFFFSITEFQSSIFDHSIFEWSIFSIFLQWTHSNMQKKPKWKWKFVSFFVLLFIYW